VVEVTVMEESAPAGEVPGQRQGGKRCARCWKGCSSTWACAASVQVRTALSHHARRYGRDLGALIGWRGETLRALQS